MKTGSFGLFGTISNTLSNLRGITKPTVSVGIDGASAKISLADLAKGSRTVHGKASCGTEVNSPAFRIVGKDVFIWPDAENINKGYKIDGASNELLSIEYLTLRGFTVIGPQASITS